MTQPADIINEAARWIGTTELPPGSNRQPFAALAGHLNGQPWCASFVVAVFRAKGMTLPSESAYTPTMANGFRQAGTWHSGAAGAQPGDVLFWDFPDSETGIEHVSICKAAPSGGQITDIGGNTSSGPGGSQDNGGGVYQRTRTTAWVVGYGRPVWTAAPVAPPAPLIPAIVHDYQEAAVKTVQMHIGPLDSNGEGWGDWQVGLGRDPIPVGLTLLGPSPPDDNGYWPQQQHVTLAAQPRGGNLRVVVRNGTPGDTVTVFATVS